MPPKNSKYAVCFASDYGIDIYNAPTLSAQEDTNSYLKIQKKLEDKKDMFKELIKSITVNKDKKIVTVVFNDKDVKMSKCSEHDTFDINIAVAICIAAHFAGSKSEFRNVVASKLSEKDRKLIETL